MHDAREGALHGLVLSIRESVHISGMWASSLTKSPKYIRLLIKQHDPPVSPFSFF